MKTISLTQNQVALVDDDDFERLNKFKWTASKDHHYNRWYALRDSMGRKILMHREIMNTPKGLMTDHINHDGLDNRKCNLRVCTNRENQLNQCRNSGKGCYFHKASSKWLAQIMYKGKKVYIGTYLTVQEARNAYENSRKLLNKIT